MLEDNTCVYSHLGCICDKNVSIIFIRKYNKCLEDKGPKGKQQWNITIISLGTSLLGFMCSIGQKTNQKTLSICSSWKGIEKEKKKRKERKERRRREGGKEREEGEKMSCFQQEEKNSHFKICLKHSVLFNKARPQGKLFYQSLTNKREWLYSTPAHSSLPCWAGGSGGIPNSSPPQPSCLTWGGGRGSKSLVLEMFCFSKKLGVRDLEKLGLNVLAYSWKVFALLKGQKRIASSFNKYILITHYVPGAVLAGYNSEQAVC